MIEKIKSIFTNKEKRIENLISFLIILIITIIIINKIIGEEKNKTEIKEQNSIDVELVNENKKYENNELEEKLENILSKITGVGEVAVLITYSESSTVVPIYNVSLSQSKIEEKDTTGGTRVTETEDEKKDIITDSNTNIITEKILNPKIEGAIITAKGASNINVKNNIILAVEAVTGLPNHKIQVFEMEE